jgi:hypothetical protein
VLGGIDEQARVISPYPEAIEDGQRVRAGADG